MARVDSIYCRVTKPIKAIMTVYLNSAPGTPDHALVQKGLAW